ncbi:hypothetical protein TNCV_1064481 [Trichonephila clavipes]|nr:hypothetical protein TNCV_1064481 [Trichonephila clavipes]
MSDSESNRESFSGASYKSRYTFASNSGTSNPGIRLSNCDRRRKAISTIQSFDLDIVKHQKLIQFNKKYGDKEKVPEILKLVEATTEEKNKLVSELRIPPCLEPDCSDHTILKPLDSVVNLINPQVKKTQKKRADSEGFVLPKKTARLTTPTEALQPIQTQNDFENLTQDPEPKIDVNKVKETLKPRPPFQ